ncbi:hypothetical protein V6C27_07750 [Peptococcaceae bacterium 1198_IL3148]
MEHPTHTRIIFADSPEEAKEKYLALNIKPDHDPNPIVDVRKVTEEEDFDAESEFNLFGEVSVGPPIMKEINKDVNRAYVIYYLEKH